MRKAGPCIMTAAEAWARVLAPSIDHRRSVPGPAFAVVAVEVMALSQRPPRRRGPLRLVC